MTRLNGRQGDFFDHRNEAEKGRDEGVERVMENAPEDWKVAAYAFVARLPRGWTGTAEDIRLDMRDAGLPGPHHNNGWGGFFYALTRDGQSVRLLVLTGERRKMRDPKSHARKTDVYRRV